MATPFQPSAEPPSRRSSSGSECGVTAFELLPASSVFVIDAGGSGAPGWTTKASQQVALISATFDAQELVPERLKV